MKLTNLIHLMLSLSDACNPSFSGAMPLGLRPLNSLRDRHRLLLPRNLYHSLVSPHRLLHSGIIILILHYLVSQNSFHTQAVESAVARQFSPAVRQPLVAEWFRSSLPSPAPGEEELLDRAGQLRLLQHLLETTHTSMARAAGLHGEEEGGLFLTQQEIGQLNNFYIRESLEQGEERVLYSVGGK